MAFPIAGPPPKPPSFEEVIRVVETMLPDERSRLRVALIARYDVKGEPVRGYQGGDPDPNARAWKAKR